MQPIKYLGNNKYLLRAETPQDEEGVKHSKNKTVEAKDWSDAERQLRKLISEVAKEKPATKKQRDNRNMSVSQLLDRYIAAKELEGKSITTLDKYRNYRRRIDEAFKGRTISELTVARIDKFSQNLAGSTNRHDENRATKGKANNNQIRGISNDYKYQIQSLLLRAIKWGDKKGYLTDNVTHRVSKLPKGEYEQIEIPDIEEIKKFINHLTEDNTVENIYKVFMNLVSWCGLRTEEILGLTWGDVNFSKRELDINKAEVKSAGKGRVKKGPKSKKSKRIVPLNNRMITMLTEWKKLCDEKRSGWNQETLPSVKLQHVILYPSDGSLPYPDTCRKWVNKYIERNGFEHVTPHGLRHFYATYLISNGVNIKEVARLAGHEDEAMTLKIYTAVTHEGYDKALAVLNAV
ncbi:MAG: site-specific integrase [Acidaminococcaceae bacterium]|nr:site-specific integrase [Acidaminococcaceae bacterium]